MNNKEKLLDILTKAKLDYEASINASNAFFSLPKRTYKRLKTDKGLCHYFQEVHNVCNLMDNHIKRFKPESVASGYWFPVKSVEGFLA